MSSSLRRGKASTPRTHNRREFGELVGVVEFACSCAGCGIDLAGGQYNLFFSNFDLLAPGDGDLAFEPVLRTNLHEFIQTNHLLEALVSR